MPYVDGKRVSLAEYKTLKAKVIPAPSVDEEETDRILGKPTRGQRRKTVKAAALVATGVTIEDQPDGDQVITSDSMKVVE